MMHRLDFKSMHRLFHTRTRCCYSYSINSIRSSSSSSSSSLQEPLLLRDYIEQSLYHHSDGYFTSDTSPILPAATSSSSSSSSSHRIDSFADANAYHRALSSIYQSYPHGWLTPVQLFSPFLSRAIANYILSQSGDMNVNIIELGPGQGTLACDILTFLHKEHPSVVNRLKYYAVDVSHTLAMHQRKVLKQWIDKGIAHSIIGDISSSSTTNNNNDISNLFSQLSSSSSSSNDITYVIATEVLDNLPHDLIRIDRHGTLQQASIHFSSSDIHDRSSRSLLWHPCTDTSILQTINAFNLLQQAPSENTNFFTALTNFSADVRDIWVPTTCYNLLSFFASTLPRANFILSDFTHFSGALPGTLAPVVQHVARGYPIVYDCVHEAPFGTVDIMFPTDFDRVAQAHKQLTSDSGMKYSVVSQGEFFKTFVWGDRDFKATCCGDGFNPIVDDFDNVAFLLIEKNNK